MKKIKRLGILMLAVALGLSGCSVGNGTEGKLPHGSKQNDGGKQQEESGSQWGNSNMEISSDILQSIVDGTYEWQDNSKDAYSAVVHNRISAAPSEYSWENGLSHIWTSFLGNEVGHTYEYMMLLRDAQNWETEEQWSYSCSDSDGKIEERTAIIDDSFIRTGGIGGCISSDHIVALRYVQTEENQVGHFFLSEIERQGVILQDIPIDFLDDKCYMPLELTGDSFGGYHVIINLAEVDEKGNAGDMVPTYFYYHPESKRWLQGDIEAGEPRCLVYLPEGAVGVEVNKAKESYLYVFDASLRFKELLLLEPSDHLDNAALADAETIVYADVRGVARKKSGTDEEMLYKFSNHGILSSKIHDIYVEGDIIRLIYENDEGIMFYLELQPTAEQREMVEITMAIGQYSEQYYKRAVAEFNKQYPSYFISLITDKTREELQTEVIAGKGPVLFDTTLVPLEENEKIWMPLNPYMEWLTEEGEYFDKLFEIGKVGDVQYGIPTYFQLETVVTPKNKAMNWDYDSFLAGYDSKKMALVNPEFDDKGYSFVIRFLMHNEEDSYFWDKEKQETYFAEKKDTLKLIKEAMLKSQEIMAGRSVVAGDAYCNRVVIGRPEHMEVCDFYYGDEVEYVGYPTRDGAAGILQGMEPIAIRKSASEEEQAAALAFLKVLLSYEGQRGAVEDSTVNMSIRRDIFEEQSKIYTEYWCTYVLGFPETNITQCNREACREKLLELIEKAEVSKKMSSVVYNILSEELLPYFEGQQELDITVKRLDNRMSLYLQE